MNTSDFQATPSKHNSNLLNLFNAHTHNQQTSAKVVFNNEAVSFKQLDQRSDPLATCLLAQKIKPEALVCVLMNRSIDAIIAKLGILKAGAAYLPMAPEDFPVDRILAILEDAQVDTIVTSKRYQTLINILQVKLERSLRCYFIDEPIASLISNKEISEHYAQISPERLAYVMYTSGSTGKPKGVMISHQNIIRSVHDTNYLETHQGDDKKHSDHDGILHAAPISFDAATFEIWGALLNGKSLYIAPESMVHNIEAFHSFMSAHPIATAWLTSALFNLIVDIKPEFFSQLSLLLIGGEALSPRHVNQIRSRFPHLRMRNNYGPTENTIFSTSFLIDKDYQNNIPIGRAISHKRAYILDQNQKTVGAETTGELFVAGEGLSRGYLNLNTETQAKFIPDPFFPGELMYATGDRCQYNTEGNIEFLGRIDNQVKISGHRIELSEIETVLQSCPQVKQAIVLVKHISHNLKGLAAYIHFADEDLEAVKRQISSKLPHYMVPTYFEAIETFPLTVNGKIDRKALSSWDTQKSAMFENNQQNVRHTLIKCCQDILALDLIELDQSFFDLGGDSLLGTRLIVELEQQLDISLPLQVLYEKPILSDIASHIEGLLTGGKALPGNETCFSLRQEAQLDDDIQLAGRTIHLTPNLREAGACIFLTGATGFFGAFLLHELLKTTNAQIHCLVRADSQAQGAQRLRDIIKKYRIDVSEQDLARIIPIPGDLTQPNFGLTLGEFTDLANSVDIIFHNGASVNYVDTYQTLKGPNVFGSQQVLKLACYRRVIPVHYISSVSVFETVGFFTGREVIYEDESVDLSEHRVQLGYSQSKWVAEKLMENAQQKGLPINIYRSGYIMGHSQTGVSNTTDHIARYIAGCIEMGCAPILEECASLAPVDQLSRAFCYVALNAQTQGKTYHLCNPNFVTVHDIYQKILNFGFPLELLPYSEWKERLKVEPSSNPLYPLLSLHIHAAPNHSLSLPELYERNTRFDCSNLIAALEGSGIDIGLNDPALFERWLEHYLEAGLISQQAFKLAKQYSLSA